MKILGNFDRAIAETLQEKVKARLQFKVSRDAARPAGLVLLERARERHAPPRAERTRGLNYGG